MSKVKQLGASSKVGSEAAVPGALSRLDPPTQPNRIKSFLQKWQHSSGAERANKDAFFLDLCQALNVPAPPPKGSLPDDPYCFEKAVKIPHPSGKITTGFADFYKADHFLIEAKQGGTTTGKGTAKRGTAVYQKEMEKAFVQALAYARNLATKPPFLLTCDIGSHFELWLGFNGEYGGYGARQTISLAALLQPEVFDLFVDIFQAPQKRNPEKITARVTREVAAELATLARSLEASHAPDTVARFLMRCVFTMFSEDAALLKDVTAPNREEKLFTDALRDRWLLHPETFKPQVEALWEAMNEGKGFGFVGRLLRFNGGLFAQATALDLTQDQLEVLLRAAQCDWTNVEPAIFGTLLERALHPWERSKLGAHYTPRSYVERLVRPVVMQPLEEQWTLVQAQVIQALNNGDKEPTTPQKQEAVDLIQTFLQELRTLKCLDPAAGTGNFLYVALDLLKALEAEAWTRIQDITGHQQLSLDFNQVNPSQFLGLETNPRAAEIASLVIWIGYLQWHTRRFGKQHPPEPVLRDFHNIEHRDAVLAADDTEAAIDPATGERRTRWGGKMMVHPATDEAVPDPDDQRLILNYINPQPAAWPEADYIISNPPFIGNARMRERLGDGYVEALRQVYPDVPDTVDYVMYWWHKAAALVREGKAKRFGFITTNTISQVRQRSVIEFHQQQKNPLRLTFAIPDHPWVDGGSAVRIAMTGAERDDPKVKKIAQMGIVLHEKDGQVPEDSAALIEMQWLGVSKIHSALQAVADIGSIKKLKANTQIACRGMEMRGAGFLLTKDQALSLDYNEVTQSPQVIKRYLNGRDLTDCSRGLYTIDLFGLSSQEVQQHYPKIYQWVYERVKPERDVNQRKASREKWWLYGESRATFRPALKGLERYIATVETAKHRIFTFLDNDIVADNKLIAVALEDAYFWGVLSSRVHTTWTLAVGGRLEDRPVYVKTSCFDAFPFPGEVSNVVKQHIHVLADKIVFHRKRVLAEHSGITLTGMYNLLEKLRAGQSFTAAEQDYNSKAGITVLKDFHDQLDTSVLDAYGWQHDISNEAILKCLVALNAKRAEEELNGSIRWLRPDYQAPGGAQTQQMIAGMAATQTAIPEPGEQRHWAKQRKDQMAALCNILRDSGEWTVEQISAQFKGVSGKQCKLMLEHLESLEAIGLLLSRTDEDGSIRWHYAARQKVG